SKVSAGAVAALAEAAPTYLGTSHRQNAVKSVVGSLREGLATLFSLPEGYEVVLGNGGTTLLWDGLTFGFIARRSQHLSFGEFSSKFAAAATAAPHLDDPEVITSDPGTHPQASGSPGVDTYALTQNETSTGVAAPVIRPQGADAGALVAVDATSAAGGMLVDPQEFDCYYFAPQKCFAADGGLWAAICSPGAVERIELIAASDRWVPAGLDLKIALDNSRLDQTYNTPALATTFLFDQQVAWMNNGGGLTWSAGRSQSSADILYTWADKSEAASPFVTDPEQRSPVVGTIDFVDGVNANVLAAVLRANGIVDTESYRKLGRNQLRIAMFPAIDPADVEALTECVDYIIERL
ncbi:MAG: phosphoserine transaminase, partial [Acidimicrobiales bacterium]